MRTQFDSFRAVLFDLDGVLTPTAEVHQRAWSLLFTPYLSDRGVRPYAPSDYFDYIDGRPRYEGVQALLASRGIELPYGEPSDSSQAETVCGLGNLKNDIFTDVLTNEGVRPYAGSVALLDELIEAGIPVGVVSSSRNAPEVLRAAGLADRFSVVVDGMVAAEHGVPGKPAPDTFSYAARALGAADSESVIIEDAVSGVAAGRAGKFGLVIGVDRGAGREVLLTNGADLVVNDLAELTASAELVTEGAGRAGNG